MTSISIAFLLNIAPLLGSVGSVLCVPVRNPAATVHTANALKQYDAIAAHFEYDTFGRTIKVFPGDGSSATGKPVKNLPIFD